MDPDVDIDDLRAQFPILAANPGLAYLDSAATSQKPQVVLDAVTEYLTTSNANVGRGTYPWANRTTARITAARHRVLRFLGDDDEHSRVHFTSGATEGLRSVALDWLAPQLVDGDEIIVPFADHRANCAPWLEVAELLRRQGREITVVPMPYDSAHDYDHRALAGLITDRTRLVAATHVHHVYGGDMAIDRIRAAAGPDVPICLDAAQSVGHLPVSARELDVDFLVFSGHKAMALPGTGVVLARNRRGPVYEPGGWAGTPNTVGIVSLVAALDWLDGVGLNRIGDHAVDLAARLTDALTRLPSYEVLGCQASLAGSSAVSRRQGIVAFRHRQISSNELGFILESEGVMVRADGHCQSSAGEETSSVRASVHVYNTAAEIDRLIGALTVLEEGGSPRPGSIDENRCR